MIIFDISHPPELHPDPTVTPDTVARQMFNVHLWFSHWYPYLTKIIHLVYWISLQQLFMPSAYGVFNGITYAGNFCDFKESRYGVGLFYYYLQADMKIEDNSSLRWYSSSSTETAEHIWQVNVRVQNASVASESEDIYFYWV